MNCPNCKKPADATKRTMFVSGGRAEVYFCPTCKLATIEGSDEPWVSTVHPFEMMRQLEERASRVDRRRATAPLVRYQDLETK